jgi:hypothetical protein
MRPSYLLVAVLLAVTDAAASDEVIEAQGVRAVLATAGRWTTTSVHTMSVL